MSGTLQRNVDCYVERCAQSQLVGKWTLTSRQSHRVTPLRTNTLQRYRLL